LCDEDPFNKEPVVRPLLLALSVFLTALSGAPTCRAAELTVTETRWLQGVWPVVEFARKTGLPLDIVVQPQPTPGAAPLAMAFIGGRCKLVLSMRGNSEAAATIERIEPDLLDATFELMAAHELGHCRRYLDGAWHGWPSGFAAHAAALRDAGSTDASVPLSAARLEEAYGDLVGLAWAQRHHPRLYRRLWAWLVAERSNDMVAGADHDTLAWVRLATPDSALLSVSIFDWATSRWAAGLGGAAGRRVSVPVQQHVDRAVEGDLRGWFQERR
jgi:hypothetical protein